MPNEWIEIFRAGTHTASDGSTRAFTEEDLDRMVEQYDPATHEAPVVIGHPKDNAPAYGWVETLKRMGGSLFYREKGTLSEFDEMRKRGMFKKRSISLYPDGTLRHVGWLGAQPPAIKGLADVAFNDQHQTVFEFTESEKGSQRKEADMPVEPEVKSFMERITTAFEGLTAKLKGEQPGGGADKRYSEADVQAKLEETKKELMAEFAESPEAKARQKALDDREAKLKADEKARRSARVKEFCEGLKEKGVLVPAMEKAGMGITAFMEAVAEASAGAAPIEFGEGDGKGTQTLYEFAEEFLSKLPAQISFGEKVKTGDDPGAGTIDAKRERAIKEYQEAHKEVSYKDAAVAVSKTHPDLFA